ncbi:MAG TPA: hypothetical protein VN698_12545 [Bacteroidia bacterium]|nr:hypothetical protein [Bacteroidia bacterium]
MNRKEYAEGLQTLNEKHDKEFKALQAKLYKLINSAGKGEKLDKDEVSSLKNLMETLKSSQNNEILNYEKNKNNLTEPIEKNKGGRPTLYNLELAQEICQAIGDSGKRPLKWVCAENPHFPDRSTILEWCIKHTAFADMYRMAYAKKLDNAHDDMIEVALNSNPLSVNCDKLIVDTLKFSLAKLNPRKYGDKAGEVEPEKPAEKNNIDISKLNRKEQKQFLELMKKAKKDEN